MFAKILSLFSGTQALGVTPEAIGVATGTLGIPEFGTSFVRGMLTETLPSTMEELVRISGLSHGTGVWLDNAQEIIRKGIAPLRGCVCTRCLLYTSRGAFVGGIRGWQPAGANGRGGYARADFLCAGLSATHRIRRGAARFAFLWAAHLRGAG